MSDAQYPYTQERQRVVRARKKSKISTKQYEHVDFLLVGYVGASSYPQCYGLSKNEHRIEAEKKMSSIKEVINLVQ